MSGRTLRFPFAIAAGVAGGRVQKGSERERPVFGSKSTPHSRAGED